jgi:hypothetical protein
VAPCSSGDPRSLYPALLTIPRIGGEITDIVGQTPLRACPRARLTSSSRPAAGLPTPDVFSSCSLCPARTFSGSLGSRSWKRTHMATWEFPWSSADILSARPGRHDYVVMMPRCGENQPAHTGWHAGFFCCTRGTSLAGQSAISFSS